MEKLLRKNRFKERLSPFLQNLLTELESQYGKDSEAYNALALQYIYNPLEELITEEINDRHYEADITEGHNVERLYKLHGCIELNFSCMSHCRYCLRSNYEKFSLSEDQMQESANYLRKIEAEEVLITGGDPMLSPKKLAILIDKILDTVPSIYVIRIATRLFTQDPTRINDEILRILKSTKERCRVEVATQINSHYELNIPEVKEAFGKVTKLGIKIYSQNVFLKGVNDTPEKLINLYHWMRKLDIESHYLFHSIPLKGTHHLRPSVKKFVDCYEKLVNSGQITGRSKPIMALMTEIGKITLTPNHTVSLDFKNNDGTLSVVSDYKLEDRLRYNSEWKLPEGGFVTSNGLLGINYLDGED